MKLLFNIESGAILARYTDRSTINTIFNFKLDNDDKITLFC